ncbi:hypothetical protein GGR76_001648 [Xanthomonas translucens]|nr:hypothetical protein [Xanthomonas campestris]
MVASLPCCLRRRQISICLPAKKPSTFGPAVFPQDQLAQGNDAPKRQRGQGLAESGTGMCRGGESDRDVWRAEELIPGRAAALTEASKPPAGTLPGRTREIRTLTPTPLPTGEGLEAARSDCPQDQLTHGNEAPKWQRGRGLAESGTGMCRGGESDRMSAEPRSRFPATLPPSPKPANRRQARCLVVFGKSVPSPQPLSRRERGFKPPVLTVLKIS